MQEFEHFELDPNNNCILACGEAHKTPILWLSSISVCENCVIVYDNNKPTFFLETSGKDEALKKIEELKAFLNEHFKYSPSFRNS